MDKTKAALQSRSCRFTALNSNFQDITVIDLVNSEAGNPASETGIPVSAYNSQLNSLFIMQVLTLRTDAGEILSAKNVADAVPQSVSTMHFCIPRVAPMVHHPLYGYVSRCEENRISLLMNFSVYLQGTAMAYTPDFKSDLLHTSFGVVQISPLRSPVLGRSSFDRYPDIGYQSLPASLVFLRCRRLISPTAAVIRKPAVLSPSFFTDSISSNTSCGTRTFTCFDLLFTEPVAITESPCVKCYSLYAKKTQNQYLTCYAPSNMVNSTLIKSGYKNGNAPDCWASTEASNQEPLVGVTVMADKQHTQTHPKFTWRFLALNRHDKKARPCRLSVDAATEREARSILAPHFILSLSARLPVQEVRHV